MGENVENVRISVQDIDTARDDINCINTHLTELSIHIQNLKNFNSQLRDCWSGPDSENYFSASDIDVKTSEALCDGIIGGPEGINAIMDDYLDDISSQMYS